jgi:hypothetical protein
MVIVVFWVKKGVLPVRHAENKNNKTMLDNVRPLMT